MGDSGNMGASACNCQPPHLSSPFAQEGIGPLAGSGPWLHMTLSLLPKGGGPE